MTDENKKINIKEELSRAELCLKEANILHNNNFQVGAISRLYYHTFHILRALLLSKGYEPKSHEGLLRLFSLHFIKSGIIEPKKSHIFSRLMKYREEADYNPSYIFTKEDYLEFQKDAQILFNEVKNILTKAGFTEES